VLKLSQLLNEEGVVTFTYAGESVTVKHRPGACTTRFSEQMDELSIDSALLVLCSDFGVEDDAGVPIPVTAEGVALLPVKFKRTMLREVLGAQYPNSPRTEDDSSSF